ncbi:MAG: hypothetical protein HFF36_09390 [Coprobacillus sp.]|nr:hypothetical protein [Coprobacillus sp.]
MSDIKRILVTGNGFDLYHCLPTAYKDFMDVVNRLLYLESKSTDPLFLKYIFGNKKNEIYKNNKNIKKCFDTYSSQLGNIKLDKNNISQMKKIAKKNYWFNYFNSCMKDTEMAWIDFEKEIRHVLEEFQDFFTLFTQIDESSIQTDKIIIQTRQLSISLRIVLNEFDFFTIEKDKKHIEREEIRISKDYCKKRFSNGTGYIVSINKSLITDFLTNELADFSKLFELYIIEFINKISVDGTVSSSIFKNVEALITFNYTDTYRNIYKGLGNESMEYIHGHAGNNNIVLGINSDKYDKLETIDTHFPSFKKEYKRILNGNLFHYKKLIPTSGKISFIFFGHSLDITDESILKDLIDGYPNATSTFYYYDEKAKQTYVKNLFKLFGKEKVEELLEKNKIEFVSVYNS